MRRCPGNQYVRFQIHCTGRASAAWQCLRHRQCKRGEGCRNPVFVSALHKADTTKDMLKHHPTSCRLCVTDIRNGTDSAHLLTTTKSAPAPPIFAASLQNACATGAPAAAETPPLRHHKPKASYILFNTAQHISRLTESKFATPQPHLNKFCTTILHCTTTGTDSATRAGAPRRISGGHAHSRG